MKKTMQLLGLLGSSFTLVGQITLVNPQPDFTTTVQAPPTSAMNLFPIDLNNDGTAEYRIRWDDYGGGSWFLHLSTNFTQMNNANFVRKDSEYLKPLEYGEAINSTNTTAGMSEPFIGDEFDANFQGLGDRYIGFRSVLSGTTRYGWILVSLVNRTLTVKEYAFTTNPNGIFAGEGGTLSVDKNGYLEKVKLYPNPVHSEVTLSISEADFHELPYRIYDLNGKLVHEGNCEGVCSIDMSHLSNGSYVIQFTHPNSGITVNRILIKSDY